MLCKKEEIIRTILKEIIPSDNTRNNIYRDAEMFKIESQNSSESFEDIANKYNYSFQTVNNIDKNATAISNLTDSRSIVLWAYVDDRYNNDVSDVIELNDSYVVSYLSNIIKEGTKKLNDVENSVRKKILDEKKFNYFSKMFDNYSSLDDLKTLYDGGDINSMDDLDFNSNSIQNVGFTPEAIGVTFSMNDGELTKPIKIDDGLIVIQLNGFVQADSLQSYSDYGKTLLQANIFANSLKIDNAIKEFSNIEDLRYKFF